MNEELIFEEEMIDEDETVVEYDIVSTPRDLTPANIVEMVDAGLIDLPLFQRNYVWDQKKASKLIESLILGLPVPELFFYSEADDSSYKIIDGQQRLLTIYFFMKGRFPRNTQSRLEIRRSLNLGMPLEDVLKDDDNFFSFKLKLNEKEEQENSPLEGLTYQDLEKEVQVKFRLRRFLRTVVVRQNKPTDDSSSMFEIFTRLNTGGAPLNHQEVRASLYYCKFYEMMVIVNDNANWRKLLGNSEPDLHCNDIELILRSFALLEDFENYIPKMVSFLNKYSQKSRKFDKEKIMYLQDLFVSFIESCGKLSDKAFYRNNRFSKVLFETVFATVCFNSYKNKELLMGKINSESFEKLKSDPEFIEYLQAGLAAQANVAGRLKRARQILVIDEVE